MLETIVVLTCFKLVFERFIVHLLSVIKNKQWMLDMDIP